MATVELLVKDAWKRIEAWLRANDPLGKLALPSGASLDEIVRAEAALGMKLPPGLRASYTLHNGSNRVWIFEQGYLLPLTAEGIRAKAFRSYNLVSIWEGMGQIAEMMKEERSEPDGLVKTDWWNRSWIPFIDNECGDHLCIDLDPPSGGHVGQVIDWWHERGATKVLARGFAEFLAEHANALEAGMYKLSEAGAVVKVGGKGRFPKEK